MKIQVIVLTMLILMIGTISAVQWDNTKNFDGDKVTIENFFGLGGKLVEVEKLENTDICMNDCYTIWNVTNHKNEKFLTNLEFKDKINVKRSIDYKFEYISGYEEAQVDIYEPVCSTPTNCIDTYVRTDTVINPIWEEMDINKAFKGNRVIKMSGKKHAQDSIDWIPSYYGVKVEEWAWWTGVEPTAYWTFNTDVELNDSSSNGNNLTGDYITTTGILNAAQNLEGETALNLTDTSDIEFGLGDFTIALWVKPKDTQCGTDVCGVLFNLDAWLTAGGWAINTHEDGRFAFERQGSNTYSTETIDDDNWHRLVFVREGTGGTDFKWYLDGENIKNQTGNYNFNLQPTNMVVGEAFPFNRYFNGSLDDVQIYNGYAWSKEDVTVDWNGGAGREATRPLNMDLNNPLPGQNLSGSNVLFDCNSSVTNADIIQNITLILDDVDDTTILGDDNLSTFKTLSDGNYNWTCRVESNGTFLNNYTAPLQFFAVDTVNPLVNIFFPTGTIDSAIAGDPLDLNYTITDANELSNCWYQYYGSFGSASQNLSSFYRFEGTSGEVIDSVRGENGLLNGTNIIRGVSGIQGNAFDYKGALIPDKVILPVGEFDYTDNFSISAWAKFNNVGGGDLSAITGKTHNGLNQQFVLYKLNDGLFWQTTGGLLISLSQFQTGQWYHLAVSVENGTSRVYINGSEVTSGSTPITGNPSRPLIIGNYDVGDFSMNGSIDELGYWDRPLKESEIQEIYNSGVGYSYEDILEFNQSINCSATQTHFTYLNGYNNITVCGNDSFSNIGCDFSPFEVIFVEEDIIFEENVYETSNQNFSLNLSTDSPVVSIFADLVYNGTSYPADIAACDGSGNCNLQANIDIPLVDVGEQQNKSFFWSVKLFNGTGANEYNTTLNTQNVTRIHLEECDATYTVETLNFTAYDAENITRIDPFTSAGSFDIWLGNGGVKRMNNFSNSTASELVLCILPEQNMKLDSQLQYSASSYTQREWIVDSYIINSTVQNISLYLTKSGDLTSFIVEVIDQTNTAVPGAIVEVERWYPGEGIFRTVQIVETDDNGKSVAFYVTETVDYRHTIKVNGQVVLQTVKGKIVPEASPFTLTFKIGDPIDYPWQENEALNENITTTLEFDDDTEVVTYTWTDPTGVSTLGRLLVYERQASSADTLICNFTVAFSSGALQCNVSNMTGSFVAYGYVKQSIADASETLHRVIEFNIRTASDVFGNTGLIIGFFIILTATLAFIWNPTAMVVALNIAVIFVNFIGFIAFGPVFIFAIIGASVLIIMFLRT